MNRLHVYKSNYNYNQQRVDCLFLADRITQEVVIPFEEFTLLDLLPKILWIFVYVKNLVNYQNKAGFSGTVYVYLNITNTQKKLYRKIHHKKNSKKSS
ncbi:MAG: hypothetical protein QXS29_10085 [Nitrososphaeria archaeon]